MILETARSIPHDPGPRAAPIGWFRAWPGSGVGLGALGHAWDWRAGRQTGVQIVPDTSNIFSPRHLRKDTALPRTGQPARTFTGAGGHAADRNRDVAVDVGAVAVVYHPSCGNDLDVAHTLANAVAVASFSVGDDPDTPSFSAMV